MDLGRATQMVRAFTVYFHLANVTEQVHRVEDLDSEGSPSERRFAETLDALSESGIPPEEVASLVDRAVLKPVFTAHPTEATRRTILEKLAEIAQITAARGNPHASVTGRARIDRRVDELIEGIWQTDEIRTERPDPIDEARFVRHYLNQTIRNAVPALLDDIDAAVRSIGGEPAGDGGPIRFGSWVGGDRDGNPNVTPGMTRTVLEQQREAALDILIYEVYHLAGELSISSNVVAPPEELVAFIDAHREAYRDVLDSTRDFEPYRRGLAIVHRRLVETRRVGPRAYASPAELLDDLAVLHECLADNRAGLLARGRLARVRGLVSTIGFHLAALDIRQHTDHHHRAVGSLTAHLDIDYSALDREGRTRFLVGEMSGTRPVAPPGSVRGEETVELFELCATCSIGTGTR